VVPWEQKVTGNVALTCRYYGISRPDFCTWYRRYQPEAPAGVRDRSRRLLPCPHETRSEVAGKMSKVQTGGTAMTI
jgi:hypothetical protein